MQHLSELTAEKIIAILPEECLDKLRQALVSEKIYNLSTFVEMDKIPDDGWFIVFEENYGAYSYLGITGHIPSFWFTQVGTSSSLHAYWIPKTGFNDFIKISEESNNYLVRLSCLDNKELQDNATTSREIRQKTLNNMTTWKNWHSPDVSVKYWMPPK